VDEPVVAPVLAATAPAAPIPDAAVPEEPAPEVGATHDRSVVLGPLVGVAAAMPELRASRPVRALRAT
jgi:hypothetical protein